MVRVFVMQEQSRIEQLSRCSVFVNAFTVLIPYCLSADVISESFRSNRYTTPGGYNNDSRGGLVGVERYEPEPVNQIERPSDLTSQFRSRCSLVLIEVTNIHRLDSARLHRAENPMGFGSK